MKHRSLRKDLLRRTAVTFHGARSHEATTERSDDVIAKPGDVFLFPAATEQPIEWVVVAGISGKRKVLLVAPADIAFLIGSNDLEVSSKTLGSLVLRFRYCVWVNEQFFEPSHYIDSLPPEEVERIQAKVTEVLAENTVGVATSREIDSDLEYRDWMAVVAAAALALSRQCAPAAIIDNLNRRLPPEHASRRGLPLAAA